MIYNLQREKKGLLFFLIMTPTLLVVSDKQVAFAIRASKYLAWWKRMQGKNVCLRRCHAVQERRPVLLRYKPVLRDHAILRSRSSPETT